MKTDTVYSCVGSRIGLGIRRAAAEPQDTAVHPPRQDDWAPGYDFVLLTDPDGTRLEGNFVPTKEDLDPPIGLSLPASLEQRLSEPRSLRERPGGGGSAAASGLALHRA